MEKKKKKKRKKKEEEASQIEALSSYVMYTRLLIHSWTTVPAISPELRLTMKPSLFF